MAQLLSPGLTEIGRVKIKHKDSNDSQEVSVYYGNIFWESSGKSNKLPDNVYRKKLEEFCNANPQFEKPSEDDLVSAFAEARNPNIIPPSQRNVNRPAPSAPQISEEQKEHQEESAFLQAKKKEQEKFMQQLSEAQKKSAENIKQNNSNNIPPDNRNNGNQGYYSNTGNNQSPPGNQKKSTKQRKNQGYSNYSDYNDQNDYEDNETMYAETEHKKVVIMSIIACVSIVAAGFMYACMIGILPFFNKSTAAVNKSSGGTVQVVQLAKNVDKDSVISKDDLKEVTITESEYKKKSSGKYIKADGTTEDDKILLWDNRNDAVGKFVTDTMKAGDYMSTSDFSELKEDESTISLDLNGQQVTVPVNVTTAGNSEIHLYAICTTTNDDGSKKTAAVDLGQFNLEGRKLTDILNSEGESKLQDYLQSGSEQ